MAHRTPTAIVEAMPHGDLISLSGPLGVATAADLRTLLHAAIDAGQGEVTLCLADAEVIDATGLGLLVEAHRRASRRGRRLVVADATPRVRRLLARTRLRRVIALTESAELVSA